MTRRKHDAAPHLIVFSILLVAAGWLAVTTRRQEAIKAAVHQDMISVKGNLPSDLPRRVLVVYNARSEDSKTLAQTYANRRGIPQENLIPVLCPITNECLRAEYESDILPYVQAKAEADPNIGYVVLMRGIPFRFSDWGDMGGYAVDSVLATCLMPQQTGNFSAPVVLSHRQRNPYFGATARFDRSRYANLLLVCRLDGPTDADAFRPVESGFAAKPVRGPFYLRDSFCMSMTTGNSVLKARSLTTEWVTPANNPLSPQYQGTDGPYMAHWGAGPHDTQYSDTKFAEIRLLPGALCDLTWSTSGSDLRNPKAQAGINLLTAHSGAAGAHGFVSEPYCDAVSRSEIVLDRYTHGYNLAESFYMGMPYLHWKDVVLGDPLCAPYAAHVPDKTVQVSTGPSPTCNKATNSLTYSH